MLCELSAVLFLSERVAASQDEEPVVGFCPYLLLNRNSVFQGFYQRFSLKNICCPEKNYTQNYNFKYKRKLFADDFHLKNVTAVKHATKLNCYLIPEANISLSSKLLLSTAEVKRR